MGPEMAYNIYFKIELLNKISITDVNIITKCQPTQFLLVMVRIEQKAQTQSIKTKIALFPSEISETWYYLPAVFRFFFNLFEP